MQCSMINNDMYVVSMHWDYTDFTHVLGAMHNPHHLVHNYTSTGRIGKCHWERANGHEHANGNAPMGIS